MSLDRYHFIIQFYSDNILLVPLLVVVDMGQDPHWTLKNNYVSQTTISTGWHSQISSTDEAGMDMIATCKHTSRDEKTVSALFGKWDPGARGPCRK